MELLKLYFRIDIDNINFYSNIARFEYKNYNYVLIKDNNPNFELLNHIFNYIDIKKPILNIYNNYVTRYDNEYYFLFYDDNNKINEIDVIKFLSKPLYIYNNNLRDKWCYKNDYIEYQITQFGSKYAILRKSINYIIGLSEIAIQLLNTINLDNCYSSLVHKRMTNSMFDLENPLNICFDYRIRDVSEYIKYMFFYEDKEIFNELVLKIKLNIEEYKLLFARLLFITPYYDMYEKIIDGDINEKEIKLIINKLDKYEEFIKKIYLYLKRYINIDNIELFNN